MHTPTHTLTHARTMHAFQISLAPRSLVRKYAGAFGTHAHANIYANVHIHTLAHTHTYTRERKRTRTHAHITYTRNARISFFINHSLSTGDSLRIHATLPCAL